MRSFIVLLALCGSAAADTLEMRQGAVHLEVFYDNDASQVSKNTTEFFEVGGVQVKVVVRVGAGLDGAEKLTVTPVDPHVMADPPYAEIRDGESITVRIIRPMF